MNKGFRILTDLLRRDIYRSLSYLENIKYLEKKIREKVARYFHYFFYRFSSFLSFFFFIVSLSSYYYSSFLSFFFFLIVFYLFYRFSSLLKYLDYFSLYIYSSIIFTIYSYLLQIVLDIYQLFFISYKILYSIAFIYRLLYFLLFFLYYLIDYNYSINLKQIELDRLLRINT